MAISEGTWKAVDALVKLLGAGGITAAITLYGMKAQESQQRIAEQNRQVNALLEFTSKQKDLDVNLRMRMFETLLSHYFTKESAGKSPEQIREKMLLLRLIALNFQDLPLTLSPLFKHLNNQLTEPSDRQALHEIASEVARRQAFRLTFEGGFDSGPTPVKAKQEVTFPNLPFTMKIGAITSDQVEVALLVDGRMIGPFRVSYFDMPITDNVKVGDLRVAVLLLSKQQDGAELRVIAFPSDLAEDRFDVKELSRALREQQFK